MTRLSRRPSLELANPLVAASWSAALWPGAHSVWSWLNFHQASHSLMVQIQHQASAKFWWFTTVYGPQLGTDKEVFHDVLCMVRSHCHSRGVFILGATSSDPCKFTCPLWCEMFPHHRLRASTSSCSDHASLLLHTNITSQVAKRFHFEAFWFEFLGFMDTVNEGWS
jgi:hypothetical protein